MRNTFGDVGILEMPSSRMAPDGTLAATFGDLGGARQRYSLSFQALPWLEASFRFSRIGTENYDQSFGLKARLVEENAIVPELSLGIRDVMGTGKYAAEYLVAGKRLGDFDLTAGLGWGRLADASVFPNQIAKLFPTLATRNTTADGGTELGQFFRGPKTGMFGGIVWQTPVDNLKLLAEYSSDRYSYEKTLGGSAHLNVRSPVNVGLSYQPLDNVALTAGWFYGTTYGVTISVSGDANASYPSAMRLGPAVPPPAVRPDKDQVTALRTMMARTDQVNAVEAGGPWIKVATPDRARQDLLQAFMSETTDVSDVEVDGAALIVEAKATNDRTGQCGRYAEIALAAGTRVTSLAMTDSDDRDGLVTICPVDASLLEAADAAAVQAEAASPADEAAIEGKLRADMAAQDLRFDALSIGTGELWLYFENYRYRDENEAIGRAARVLMADAPPAVEIFHIVPVKFGVPMQQVTIGRGTLERTITSGGLASEALDAISVDGPPRDTRPLDRAADYPVLTWAIDPKLSEHLFDPKAPLQVMGYGDATALLQIMPGLMIQTELTATIFSTYSFTRDPASSLPHVRSDLLQYLDHGKYGISNLELIYRTRLAPSLFAEVRGGYLEDMYMGAGAQLLWRPDDSRFSLGGDLYQVWKRDYDRLFGHQGYDVVTGHVSVYYRSPWYGLDFAVHGGRYLAGDYGGTIEVTRRFSTGIEIGAWVTFTNVSFSRFGEGSFDKGIIIHIPFEWGLPVYSQAAYDLHLHSLARDGGQRLADDDSLYGTTRGTSYDEIMDHLDEVVAP